MLSVKWWFDVVYLLIQRLLGAAMVHEIKVTPNLVEHLTGYSISGYEIRLYCQKKVYRRTYQRWPNFGSTKSVFQVYSVISQDAPPCLKEACELNICLPNLVPEFLSEAVQKELAVQVYLDILINRLENRKA